MFSYLRSVLWMCPLVGLATVVMGSISFVASLFDATGRLQHRVAVAWARLLLKVCMVRIDVIGAEQLDPSQVYVFCSNHFSLIDTPVMFGSIPREFRILARHGLWRVPFLGWHLSRAGHIPVHRENPRAAARNIHQAAEKLREGYSILIFPEGGRTRQPVMRPFKTGAAYIAIQAQTPLVPMALVGTRAILPPASAHLHPGRAELRIGTPRTTTGLTNRDAARFVKEIQEEVARLAERPLLP
jgi:1-acyl-sn-glycerol-3-phosphate acyltransferase